MVYSVSDPNYHYTAAILLLITYLTFYSCCRKIEDCFGFMISVQVCQGSAVAVLVLLKVAVSVARCS